MDNLHFRHAKMEVTNSDPHLRFKVDFEIDNLHCEHAKVGVVNHDPNLGFEIDYEIDNLLFEVPQESRNCEVGQAMGDQVGRVKCWYESLV